MGMVEESRGMLLFELTWALYCTLQRSTAATLYEVKMTMSPRHFYTVVPAYSVGSVPTSVAASDCVASQTSQSVVPCALRPRHIQ